MRPNQWILFEDENGRGYAQPDLFLVTSRRILLFEVKLTETREGTSQLEGLYSPLLSFIFSRPVVKILVCKNLRPGLSRIEVNSFSAICKTSASSVLTWQWLP